MARMRPHVVTRKHYVQSSLFTVAAGAKTFLDVVDAVAVTAKNAPDEVEEGSIVSAIYFEYWLTTNDTSSGSVICVIEKVPAGATPVTAAQIAALDTYANKKNVFKTFMGLTNPSGGVAMPAFRVWIKIPKSKQRFGLGDKITFTLFSQTGTLQGCGFCTYKEQM